MKKIINRIGNIVLNLALMLVPTFFSFLVVCAMEKDFGQIWPIISGKTGLLEK